MSVGEFNENHELYDIDYNIIFTSNMSLTRGNMHDDTVNIG